ncbi:MAG: UDP-N-acetylmuramoylalanyl-D-glutamyl-2, 6-diaminopimelate--D-alanyl-D-alanine ligase, partial [Alphaproteobacteria bacterium]|nr:UDP-N-acetylmuramoylalanyl-D-glutamyl-2, 6-diaminopimelate--D-alanyl-D-alanine ligase [Alphaproteobacteria bacterium]
RAAHAADADALIAPLREALRPGDVVVVKGSYSSGMGKIVKALLALAGTDQQKQEAAHAPSKGG